MGCCSSSNFKNYEDDRGAAGGTPVNSNNIENEADLAAEMISGDSSLSVRVDLSISCEGLQNLDRGSKSDPFCVIYTKKSSGEQWTEVSRTEIIANNLSPKFVTLIPMTYHFEQVQYLKFEVYDADSSFSKGTDSVGLRLAEQDFQGSAECVLAEIMGSHQQTWSGALAGGGGGTVAVRGEERAGQSGDVELRLRAEGLTGGGGRPDAFLRLARVPELGAPLPFYKSEVKRGAGAPIWNSIRSTLQVFANGDQYRPVQIELFDWKRSGDHKLIGSCMASINDLQAAAASNQALRLTNNNSNTGSILVDKCEVKMTPSFLSYVAGGTELLFDVAIDYTASNGDPTMPDSLHHIDPTGQNLSPYAQAIVGVGGVLQHYDSDKRFPVYGFGGKLGPGQPASHCFAVNGNDADPHVTGINGILQLYYESLQRVTLSGPTIFQNIISQVAAFSASQPAATDPTHVKYHVLLILTDGMINDMQNTVDAIVQASSLPLSIIIVGVGNADFSAMHKLDADEHGLVSSTGRPALRDIVQFVPLNRVTAAVGMGGGGASVAEALAKEVLAEVPRQFIDYMRSKNLTPSRR